jgi:D-threo-aldose 1-dehydrogenase
LIATALGGVMSIRDRLTTGPLGLGAAPLGNIFGDIPDAGAATVETAG